MIIKRRGVYVTEKHSVPMLVVCKGIGSGNSITDIKNMYPVSDDDITDCIQFFCKYTQFDPYHIMTFKNLTFNDYEINIKIQEISAECYMRMLNRSIWNNKRIKDFNQMLLEGLSISFKNACEILDGRITEADALNPVFDKALATEIEMFLQMTDRNAIDEIQKLDLDNFDNNEIYLEDTD